MKKILLPTDFSDNAWNAIFTGLKLYADVKCHFYLLHAYEPHMMNLIGRKNQLRLGIIYDSLSQYSTQELRKIAAYLDEKHQNPNHVFEILSKADTLEEAVMEMVSKRDIDLIVMGTQGATGAREIFMGSNTVKVINKVENCPVLAVPSGYNFQILETLVYSTDFSRHTEKHELLPLTSLAALWKAEIHILYVAMEFRLSEKQKANKKILEERIKNLTYSFHDIDLEANLAQTIAKSISEYSAAILVMIRYPHTFWEKITHQPTVKKIAFHSRAPLLVLPGH